MPFILLFKTFGSWLWGLVKAALGTSQGWCAILGLVVGIGASHWWDSGTIKDLKTKVDADEKVFKELDEKRIKLEKDSAAAAAEASQTIKDLNTQLDQAAKTYQELLKTKTKERVVEIQVPGIKETVEIIKEPDGYSCRRLPQEYVDTINKMVTIRNQEVLK